ncbi:hypothetical protein EUTSA_v10013760mg [Eutrema salsugineum]|uniref:Peptidase A1 domain-containing protein n=1 Tax=Eutrema salsugineum TaxID=72664 RepID=V4KVB6_EUTSA|nr:basic 7S globulin 2 [Eutrema salsugineum]ESQ41920.1 hypothetical protein EUTSA_v10013760mg [Eutrema salsugineum]
MQGLTRHLVFLSIFAAVTLKLKAQYLLPINKHQPTKQFYTTLNIGSSPKSPINLVLDLETNLSWLNCRKIKSLSTYRRVGCNTSLCNSLPNGHCQENTCYNSQPNPLNRIPLIARLGQDRASFTTTDGNKTSVRNFTFLCAGQKDLRGFSPPAAGVLGLSPGALSFPKQVTSAFNVIPKFALCLPSSSTGPGHLYVGTGPYFNDRLSNIPMTFTPFTITESGKYLISVKAIYVDGFGLSLDRELLVPGAKLSTVVPYTTLQSDVYTALAKSFTLKAEAMGLYKVSTVAPFKDCFDVGATERERKGPNVPVIEIGLPGRIREVRWSFHGANTVVRVLETVVCLAFIDGGKRPNDLMVIGTHQLQDYLVELDFSRTVLAFSDSLLLHNTSCSS